MLSEHYALHVAHCAVRDAASDLLPRWKEWGRRHVWRMLRLAGRYADRIATDRLEWRARTVPALRLRGGQSYPVCGPTGRLP